MPRKRIIHRKKAHRRMHGSGFFSRLWEGIKTAVRKPSTWITGASMIPSPLSAPLGIAGTIAGLAGHGRRRRARRRVGRGYPVMRTMPYKPIWMDGRGRRKIGRGVPSTDPIA